MRRGTTERSTNSPTPVATAVERTTESPQERVQRLAAERVAAIEAEEAATVYQLALWKEEHKRAMPVDFIRSALFAAIQAKDATYLQREQIASANGYIIIFTGRRLTQVHADVWEGIMYLAGKGQKSERDYVAFTAGQLLRLIGRATGKSQHEQLRRMISELTATSVEILDSRNKRRFWGSLLPKGGDQEIECDTQYLVSLNRDIVQLFARGIGTIDFRQRKKLLKKPLALWLQHFLSDDSKPVTVEFLHKHSGSTARSLRHFREQLRLALEELVRVGILESWQIDKEDVVTTAGAPGSRTRSERPTQEANIAVGTAVASSSPRELAPVAAATKAEFSKMYPEHDVETCVAAWHAWPKSRFARNRHIAFLGFARKWIAEQ